MNIPVNFEKELAKSKLVVGGINYRMDMNGGYVHPVRLWLIPENFDGDKPFGDTSICFTIPFGLNWGYGPVQVDVKWAKKGTGDHWLGGTDTQIVISRDNLMTRQAFIDWLVRVVPIVKNLM